MKRSIPDIIGFMFIVLFAYAAFSKLFEFELFRAQIGKSPMITQYASLFAWAVPALEIVICLLLLFPKTRIIGFYCSFTLMFLFTGYIFMMLKLSPYVPCSCGGILSGMGWTEHLFFNVGFTLLAIAGVYFDGKFQSVNGRDMSGELQTL